MELEWRRKNLVVQVVRSTPFSCRSNYSGGVTQGEGAAEVKRRGGHTQHPPTHTRAHPHTHTPTQHTFILSRAHSHLPTRMHTQSGYLMKRAKTSGRNWKKRYFVLSGHTITYYVDHKSKADAKGSFLLTPKR